MSVANYGELKTAVANWLNRSDLTSYIPDFITIGESYINTDLRIREMIARVTASTTAADAYLDLPSDFAEMYNIQINTTEKKPLKYMTPELIDLNYSSDSGVPKVYTIIGSQIQFAPIPDSAYTIEIAYYQKFANQSSDTDSNWLHTSAPHILIYSALIAAEPFLKNDARLGTWINMYEQSIEKLNKADKKGTKSGSGLMTQAG